MLGFIVGEELQFVGILNVHNFVANVVCSLDEIDQRMARRRRNAEFVGNVFVGIGFGVEKAEFTFFCGVGR